ncbi:MAG: hypothetical protein A2133_06395 [Actinobacteria bacterium RBG_16_64_13]|nr:MAG: hypothetical protein A2133_06395 [Actinobacteria bacterium RBG_16_64_13]
MQAGSVKATPPLPLVPVGKAVAVTVIMGLVIAIFPLLPVLVIPFLGLPLAHVVARWGVPSGAMVAVITAALVYAGVGPSAAVLVFLLLLGVGMVVGWAVRKSWRFGRSLALATAGALAALAVSGVVMWLAFGVDLTWLKEVAYSSIDDAAAQYTQLGMSVTTAQSAAAQMRDIVDIVPYLSPGLLAMGSILLAVCSLGLAYALFPRLRDKVAVDWSLSGFRMHWAVAYVSIAGLAMLLFSRGDGTFRTVLLYAGVNLLLVSQTLFFVEGLAVARWFIVDRHLRRGARVAIYIGAVLGQVLFQLTGLVGLFDTWVDYRKRFALKSPGAGSPGNINKE